MPCRKGTKQTPQSMIDEIIAEHSQGATRKELAEKYNKPFGTIKAMIKRENEKKRKLAAGIALKKKGRPPKNYPVTSRRASVQADPEGIPYKTTGNGK